MRTITAYHGTGDKEFPKPTEIRISKAGNDYGPGLYFADQWEDIYEAGPLWYEATLALRNPLVVGGPGDEAAAQALMRAFGWSAEQIADQIEGMDGVVTWVGVLESVPFLGSPTRMWQTAYDLLRRNGHDSIFVPGAIVNARRRKYAEPIQGNYVVVLDPESITAWGMMPFKETLARARAITRERRGY
jgi:hypothetical protein